MAVCPAIYAQIPEPEEFFEFMPWILPDSSALIRFPISDGENGVAQFIAGDSEGKNGKLSVDYYDGLGYPIEKVKVRATPSKSDLVYLLEYDSFGRKHKEWLPAVQSTQNGAFFTPSQVRNDASSSHGNDNMPYSTTFYEDSPLNRVVAESGPGEDWYNNNKRNKIEYLTNTVSDNLLTCRLLSLNGNTAKDNGFYVDGVLQVTKKIDEEECSTLEFRNRQNRLVLLRKVMPYGEGVLDTYYIYDGFGNLRMVFPPQMSALLSKGNISQDLLNKYAYIYKYDSRNRMTSKQLPGASPISMVYDEADRIILSQDGVQAKKGLATFHIYDAFGRECITGECKYVESVPGTYVHCQPDKNGLYMGYSITGFTPNQAKILTVNYYDDYDVISNDSLSYISDESFGRLHNYPRGLLTGQASLRLNKGGMNAYDYTTFYYDEHGRVIQLNSTNHLGGYDRHFTEYSYTGKPIRRKHVHSVKGKPCITEVYKYTYDHEERLLESKHSINGRNDVSIISYKYTPLGLVSSSQTNNLYYMKKSYSYNIRSWLKSINSHSFIEKIYYNTPNKTSSNQKNYSGKISSVEMRVMNGPRHDINYYYDGASRLMNATYIVNDNNIKTFDTFYDYDLNGNITSVSRCGNVQGAWSKPGEPVIEENELIDNLTLDYNGNHMTKVTNHSYLSPSYGVMHFIDGSDKEIEYEYDENGNLVKDYNRNISLIQYNSLNLPMKIDYSDNTCVEFLYDSKGTKLQTYHQMIPIKEYPRPIEPVNGISEISNGMLTHNSAGEGSVFTFGGKDGSPIGGDKGFVPIDENETEKFGYIIKRDYCDNVVYKNNNLDYVLFEGGYITNVDSVPVYHFYVQDHLKNNILVINGGGSLEQTNFYYPFGTLTSESSGGDVQAYKFGGKELDGVNNYDCYDFGGRIYNPLVGRFTTMDPLAEKYYDVSPYAYCANDPVNAVDPDGKKITYVNGSKSYIYSNGNFYVNKGQKDKNSNWMITGSKVNVSPKVTHMYRTLMALRKMDNSNNPTIKKVFDTVSNVNDIYEHKITKKGKINHATSDDSGGSIIYLNFGLVDNYKSSVDFRDVGLTDYELLGHELKHSYNMEFYKTKTGNDPKSGIEIEEIETVNFENLIRKEEGMPKRTKYGSNIPKEYLEKKVTL